MSFHVGQKVVCVDASPTGKYLPRGVTCSNDDMHGLKLGRVYTVRYVGDFRDLPVCCLDEIIRPVEPLTGKESGYAQARFRPVVERKTDISVFTEMLKRWKVPA
jgi:hypothetical protein